MRKKLDATQGSLFKLILIYTIPLIMTTILQHMFTIVDKAVLGNMANPTAVASVGATGTVTGLIINGFVGFSTGTTIVLSRVVGEKNEKRIRETIDTSLISSVCFGLLVAIAGFFLAPLFLRWTNCPQECYDGALLYMRIYLAASPATLLYNYGSAILRSLGDTRRPLNYIMIGGVVNLILNVLLCLILPQKVAAVAIATVASKVIGAVLVVNRLCHWEDSARVSLRRICFRFAALGKIVRMGIPPAINQLVYPLANLQIVSAINSYGVDAMAGQSAASSLQTICGAITGGFGAATTTFMGQNIGAQKPKRVFGSFWRCMAFGTLIGGGVGFLIVLTGHWGLGLILGFSSTAAIEFGKVYLFYVTQFGFVSGINSVLVHALQAYGYPVFGSINAIVFTLGFRIVWMQFIYPLNPTWSTLMLCFTVSWILVATFNSVMTTIISVRYRHGKYKKI